MWIKWAQMKDRLVLKDNGRQYKKVASCGADENAQKKNRCIFFKLEMKKSELMFLLVGMCFMLQYIRDFFHFVTYYVRL